MKHETYRAQRGAVKQMQKRQIALAVLAAKDAKRYMQPGARRISAIEKASPGVEDPSEADDKTSIYIIPVGGGNVK